jgi:hypothetical protein
MAVKKFKLFWSSDRYLLPNASAFKPPHSKRYKALEDALEQAKTPPNTKDKHLGLKQGGCFSRRTTFECSINREKPRKADPEATKGGQKSARRGGLAGAYGWRSLPAGAV